MSSSDVTVIPERFCGLRVLLVEQDVVSLQKHACLLQKSSYQVTIKTEASAGLSMIANGQTFDCLLIDGDLCETEMEPFLRQVWRHQPQLSIIVMAAYDVHLRIPRDYLENGAVLCLLKPSCFSDICNIWKHICRNKISSEENVLEEMLYKEDQVDINIPREPSATNNGTAINNNILSNNFTDRQALGINSQEQDVTFEDFFSEVDGGGCGGDVDDQDVNEMNPKESIGIGATGKDDKGKQPLIKKRKHNQPVEDDNHTIKKRGHKLRVSWKGELDDKFHKALKELGEQATSKEILRHMKVKDLTRFHVGSHQQKYRNKLRNLEAEISELAQMGTKFQVEGVTNERFRHPIRSDVIAPVTKSSSILRLPKLNLNGILYMLIENIRNIILQPTITHNNNYDGEKASVHSSRGKGIEIPLMGYDYGIAVDPLVRGESSSRHPFGEEMPPSGCNQATAQSFGMVENSNGGGHGTGIQLTGHVYGNPVDPMETRETSSRHAFGEAMAPLGGDQRTIYNIGVVQNSNFGGQRTRIQLTGHDYANAVDPSVTGETSSHHTFEEAMAPLGSGKYGGEQETIHNIRVVENSSGGCQGNRIQLMGHDYGNAVMDPMVTGETSSHQAFGEAMPPLGDDNYGGQGTQIQLTSDDYGNAMEPHVSDEISGQHAFGEAITPLGTGGQTTANSFRMLENFNSDGHGFGNATQPQTVSSEIFLHHAFGETMAPLGTGDQTTAHSFRMFKNISSSGHGFGNATEPLAVSSEISSQHGFGGAMDPLCVGEAVASDNNPAIHFNPLLNGVDKGIIGDASGSDSNEDPVQIPWFRPEPEPSADFGGIEVIVNHNHENVGSPDVFSNFVDLYPSQDVHVTRESLGPDSPPPVTSFDQENSINPGSNLDSVPSGPASADFSIPEFPTEENEQTQPPGNSVFPLYDSEAGFIDNVLGNSDLENTKGFFNGDDGNLFDGPFYF